MNIQEKANGAARLCRLLAKQHPAEKAALDTWSNIFSLPQGLPPLDRQHRVAELLTAAVGELRGVVASLRQANVPAELIDQYVSRVENAFSIANMHGKWSQSGGGLAPDTLLALKWFAHVLPEETNVIGADDLQELGKLLDELEERLASPGVPPDLVRLIQKHAAAIRSAIFAYPVQGPASIRRASRAMIADIHLDEDEIRRAAETGEKDKVNAVGEALKKLWSKSASVAGDLDKFGKGAKALSDAGEFIGTLLLSGPT